MGWENAERKIKQLSPGNGTYYNPNGFQLNGKTCVGNEGAFKMRQLFS